MDDDLKCTTVVRSTPTGRYLALEDRVQAGQELRVNHDGIRPVFLPAHQITERTQRGCAQRVLNIDAEKQYKRKTR